MENVSSIVVVGEGVNPSKLQTQFDPIKLKSAMTMAVTSISHGEVINVTEHNNQFRIWLIPDHAVEKARKYRIVKSIEFSGNKDASDVVETDEEFVLREEFMRIVVIDEGRYNTKAEILAAIETKITSIASLEADLPYLISAQLARTSGHTYYTLTTSNIYIETAGCKLWHFLGVYRDIEPDLQVTIEDEEINFGIETAFLYVNIVESSYINNKLSRNLSVLPISLFRGASYYEVKNPVYLPIIVKDFTHIDLELRNIHGKLVKFVKGSSLIITLNLRPIKGMDLGSRH